jgi:hypothetical protein
MNMNMKKITLMMALMIAAAAVFAQQAVIKNMNGTVELQAAGSTAWTPAKIGDVLQKNTRISTGFKSTAVLSLGNSTITVRSLTQLSLEELSEADGNETVSLGLQTGRVRANVNPPANGKTDFVVRAPSATASVRGTQFEFDGTNLLVSEGTVAYRGAEGRAVMVSSGGESAVDAVSGRSAEPMDILVTELTPPAPAGAAESGLSSAGVVSGHALDASSASGTVDTGVSISWE